MRFNRDEVLKRYADAVRRLAEVSGVSLSDLMDLVRKVVVVRTSNFNIEAEDHEQESQDTVRCIRFGIRNSGREMR